MQRLTLTSPDGSSAAGTAASNGQTPQQALRERHRTEVIRALRAHSGATQASLATRLGVSKATVSRVLSDLRLDGMIEHAGNGSIPRGRKPALVRLKPEARLAVGVEFEDARCVAGVTDLDARLLRRVVTTPRYDTPQELLSAVVEAFVQAVEGLDRDRICALGVGVPGFVEPAVGVLRAAPALSNRLRDVPLGDWLAARLGLPVVVANRGVAATVGEHLYGAGRGSGNLVYVRIGVGIAGGIILGGQLQVGASGAAGGLGHVIVEPGGPLCACGSRGCLQALAAAPAIVQRARARLKSGAVSRMAALVDGMVDLVDADTVLAAAAEGDPVAQEVLDEAGTYLGRALAAVVNLLNPDTIVLGGPVGERAAPLFIAAVERELRACTLSLPAAAVRIVPGTLGEDAGAIGAAALALEQAWLSVPI